MRLGVYILILMLAACQRPIVTDIPAIPKYTEEQQAQDKEAFNSLPSDSHLRVVLQDCRYLRDQLRVH
jgi:hypothetical protein